MVLHTKQPDGEAKSRANHKHQNQPQRRLEWIRLMQSPPAQATTHRQGAQPDQEKRLNFGQGLVISCCL